MENEINLKGQTLPELRALFAGLGEPEYRAKQAFTRINKHLAQKLEEFTEFPKALRAKLEEASAFPETQIERTSLEQEGTEKAVFLTGSDKRDGEKKLVEAVWIVSMQRRTACISSQVGCSLSCAFCATGTLKFRGNLKAWQIVDQVYGLIRHRNPSAADASERLTNVVFMGMGEPFYNYDQVMKAAHLLHDPGGLNLGAKHITISTAGVVPGIDRFTEESQPFNLAISLNHPDPEGRREIMDVTEKFPLEELLRSVRNYGRTQKRPVTFEYIMIPDKNMGRENLEKLVAICRSVNAKINLIPLNTNLNNWRRPDDQEMIEFQEGLRNAGILAFNRGSPGRKVGGACGMLALQG